MTDDEKNWLAADYVLGVMRGSERVAFESRLKGDPALSKAVFDWQSRMNLLGGQSQVFLPTMSDADVDAALGQVFERVCKAIDGQPEGSTGFSNPLAKLSKDQLAAMRPAVVRLIASYLVLLERLKVQQARLLGNPGAA